MHRLLRSTAVLAALAFPVAAKAQIRSSSNVVQPTEGVRWGIGAGLTLPLGNYSTADNLGFHGLGFVQMPLHDSPLHLRFDAMLSSTSHKSGNSGSTRLLGADADVVYHLGARHQPTRPYLLGGVGLYNVHVSLNGVSGSNTNFAVNLGGGILFGLGRSTHAFLEARWLDIMTSGGSTTLIPITFGLTFSGNR